MGDEERDDIIEEEEESTAGEPSRPSFAIGKSKILRILLFIAGGILFIVLVIGISYWVSRAVQESEYERRQDIVAAPPPGPLQVYEMPEFSTTTADVDPYFVSMKISLGYDPSVELQNELIKRRDQMQHIINILLRGKRAENLKTVEDAIALAEEIKAHINMVLVSGKIKEVYFREFVVN